MEDLFSGSTAISDGGKVSMLELDYFVERRLNTNLKNHSKFKKKSVETGILTHKTVKKRIDPPLNIKPLKKSILKLFYYRTPFSKCKKRTNNIIDAIVTQNIIKIYIF